MRVLETTVLDIGCGSAKHAGAFGLDIGPGSQADVLHDLRDLPWPVPSDHFTHVYCQDILEHLPDVGAVMREVHRVCVAGARVEIRTPHFSSWYAYNDPTHEHVFGYFALDRYVVGRGGDSSGPGLFRYLERRFCFARAHRMTGVSYLANRFPARYEQLFAWLCPCENLLIRLSAVK